MLGRAAQPHAMAQPPRPREGKSGASRALALRTAAALQTGWTGAQFSLLRAAAAAAVVAGHAGPAGAGLAVAIAGGALLVGWREPAVLGLLGVLAAGAGAGWLALTAALAALVPPGAYGALSLGGGVDPGSTWRMPFYVPLGAWLLLPAHVLQAWGLLHFTPALLLLLLLAPGLWPALWVALAAGGVAGGVVPGLPGLVLLALAADPAWLTRVRPDGAAAPESVFYDGHCGLCHNCVRFILSEDRAGVFRLAPLQSEAFEAAVDAETRAALPDSIVVLTRDGRLLLRSDAIAHILAGLGGVWTLAAALLRLLPRALRDGAYGFVASIRHRIFAPPPAACPRLPAHLRSRFAK